MLHTVHADWRLSDLDLFKVIYGQFAKIMAQSTVGHIFWSETLKTFTIIRFYTTSIDLDL